MSRFLPKMPNLLRKYEQLFIGLVLGMLIFLAFTFSTLNAVLFLVLAQFVMTLILYVGIIVRPDTSLSIIPILKHPEKKQEAPEGFILIPKPQGRPKGSKNKPKIQGM